MAEQFFALIPDAGFSNFLRRCKQLALEATGPQKYLEDDPHLTLGAGDYPPGKALESAIRNALPGCPVSVGLAGWHTFFDDPITKGNTLVLKVAPQDVQVLRAFQVRFLEGVKDHRTKPIPARYSDRSRYSPAMEKCLDRYGFPFVGSIWEPHFTIASFSPAAHAKVWDRLQSLTPPPFAGLAGLAHCQIQASGFVEIRKWNLGK